MRASCLQSPITRAGELTRYDPHITPDRLDPGRKRAIAALGFRFLRRRLQLGDAIVGRGSSPFNFHRPVVSFVTTPRTASCRNRSPVADRLLPAALASAITLKPGLSRIAASSFRSAVFAEVDGRAGWRICTTGLPVFLGFPGGERRICASVAIGGGCGSWPLPLPSLRHDQTCRYRDRARTAEDIEKDKLPFSRAHAGIDALEAAERAVDNRDLRAWR
jgi:hypothetical protein